MTDFNRETDLPAAIDTVEKLKVWVDSLLQRLYGSKEYEETEGAYLQPVVDYSIVRTSDKKVRQITRSSIPINQDYLTATTQKFWTFADSLGDVEIPAAFKVD
ncbi:glucose-6-phosphate dehydrogenase [Nodosilinea sp. FACHB-13]|uniref:glucose-6-phosphate dehydrogenase n=1 Tax=Cyanophyceae TaxID=3028117 RepID=UPI0016839825|nr:glucose-6-phosphate dehydrogenase [Nodosilinea sp. FACHB-13]MBD2107431.1 glucose-6-phosphate dehydrogenase [Nodosilinea sp. FACHB-13]